MCKHSSSNGDCDEKNISIEGSVKFTDLQMQPCLLFWKSTSKIPRKVSTTRSRRFPKYRIPSGLPQFGSTKAMSRKKMKFFFHLFHVYFLAERLIQPQAIPLFMFGGIICYLYASGSMTLGVYTVMKSKIDKAAIIQRIEVKVPLGNSFSRGLELDLGENALNGYTRSNYHAMEETLSEFASKS
ncbi:hypothetical protein T4D_5692 [Trichinella pseudospiralis]|uniref:Transmembrane protein n=1 Tax=Trichinella pseudospiralis TaxID=6337 RepID=A0A0V1FEC7_TRIPS|nr:hypothetical protein T4D_5692 [Trichinella pseudospiralis]